MYAARPFVERNIHPTIIVGAYHRALKESLRVINDLAININTDNDEEV